MGELALEAGMPPGVLNIGEWIEDWGFWGVAGR